MPLRSTSHVAVGNQPDTGAGLAYLIDDVTVSIAVQNDGGDVADSLALRFGDCLEVCRDWSVDVDHADGVGANGDLLHVDARTGIEHCSPVADRQHCDGVRSPQRGQGGAVDGIDRHVAKRGRAVANGLAVVEHRRLVLFAFADDDDAVHLDAVEDLSHGINCGAVGSFLVPSAHPACSRHGCRLGDSYQLES